MISRVQVKNYRSLVDVDVTLGPLTVLVGRNGTGKSTFIDVLRFVRDALTNSLGYAMERRHDYQTLSHWKSTKEATGITLIANESEASSGQYSLEVEPQYSGAYRVASEKFRYGEESFDISSGAVLHSESLIRILKGNSQHLQQFEMYDGSYLLFPLLRYFASHSCNQFYRELTESNFYSFAPGAFRPSQEPASQTTLRDTGDNLLSTLKKLAETEWRASLISAFKCIVEDVQDYRVQQVGGLLFGELKHAMNGQEQWEYLTNESDGTLRALGILAALYQDVPPQMIAIEEPELHLHPGALETLSEVLRESALRRQVIVTTQSADLISYFKPEELRIVTKVDGATQIRPLDGTQAEAIHQELFKAGDLLRIQGLQPAA